MLTPAEYSQLPFSRKRDYALAVDALERMCAEALALVRRTQSALVLGADGRAEADRCELVAMCKRNEIFSRQTEYAMSGLPIHIATDDRGFPIRVRRPLGFQSLEALATEAAKQPKTPSPQKRRAK